MPPRVGKMMEIGPNRVIFPTLDELLRRDGEVTQFSG